MNEREREAIILNSAQMSLEALVHGAEKASNNAERLFFEAKLLGKAGCVARALCLHQISLEEGSKIDTLRSVGSEPSDGAQS